MSNALRALSGVVAMTLLVAACGGDPKTSDATGAASSALDEEHEDAQENSSDASTSTASGGAPAPSGPFASRTGELVNPDNATMVFLYYDLAGITPPIDSWVEEDSRVKYAPAPDKAAKRAAVKSELEAGAASVRNAGAIRLSMNANLSEYDPSYGEFTVRALAPSSVVDFDALGQKVQLKFRNGRTAQIWRVPATEAQGIRDKIGYSHNVSMDVGLRIVDVQPGPGGGTLTADVLDYELRHANNGQTIGRITVNAP